MKKSLEEMTKEELWQLFPIFFVPHHAQWKNWYEEEVRLLQGADLAGDFLHFYHIGSTAVEGIYAKPIIDILAEVGGAERFPDAEQVLFSLGYRKMSQEKNRASYNKGYTEDGFAEKVFHLHLRLLGDRDEVYFRAYLQQNPQIAKAYEELKLFFGEKYEHDRDAYTAAKGEFISKHTQKAKKALRDETKGRKDE